LCVHSGNTGMRGEMVRPIPYPLWRSGYFFLFLFIFIFYFLILFLFFIFIFYYFLFFSILFFYFVYFFFIFNFLILFYLFIYFFLFRSGQPSSLTVPNGGQHDPQDHWRLTAVTSWSRRRIILYSSGWNLQTIFLYFCYFYIHFLFILPINILIGLSYQKTFK
jgi:hypothetical protein